MNFLVFEHLKINELLERSLTCSGWRRGASQSWKLWSWCARRQWRFPAPKTNNTIYLPIIFTQVSSCRIVIRGLTCRPTRSGGGHSVSSSCMISESWMIRFSSSNTLLCTYACTRSTSGETQFKSLANVTLLCSQFCTNRPLYESSCRSCSSSCWHT